MTKGLLHQALPQFSHRGKLHYGLSEWLVSLVWEEDKLQNYESRDTKNPF